MAKARPEYSEQWYSKSWRPAAAFVYMAICLFDFALAPMYFAYLNHNSQITALAELALRFDPSIQLKVLSQLQDMLVWQPITLKANGLFHASMAALLGVSAYSRSQEKIAKIESDKAPVGMTPEVTDPTPVKVEPKLTKEPTNAKAS